jgi:molybdopterin-guanine dinucleotide biosynthesis protein A
MGYPKHLLTNADGIPMYLTQLRMLHDTFPDAKHLCIIVQDEAQRSSISIPHDLDACLLSQETLIQEKGQWGLATAVFSASTFDDTCHWLILPCDYPLLTGSELRHLSIRHRDPVTCFRNGNGETEPLVAIWSPEALSHIDLRTMHTRDHLSGLIDGLAGTKIAPLYDHSLFNANTKEDWDDAMQLLCRSRINHLPDQSSECDV